VSDYFLDSSALAKRYLTEVGTAWVRGLLDPIAGHTIWIAEITEAEVAAALPARQRAPRGITRQERDAAVALLAVHCSREYQLIALNRTMLDIAIDLTQRHRLRAYDAVQLATALAANATLLAAGLSGLRFVVADSDLIAASHAECLAADNPNQHP
jgi:predicted nucleic acid-binding protein